METSRCTARVTTDGHAATKVEMMKFVLKPRNFVSKPRNCVSKTRNFVLKMMNRPQQRPTLCTLLVMMLAP